VLDYPGGSGKEAMKWVSVCLHTCLITAGISVPVLCRIIHYVYDSAFNAFNAFPFLFKHP